MQRSSSHGNLYPVVEQVTNNTTSWIGRDFSTKDKEVMSGQTFSCPEEGILDSIEIYSSIVIASGQVLMTLHDFDPVRGNWGPKIGSATVDFNKQDSGKWISFPLNGPSLQRGMSYGFLLQSPASLIGVGEAVGTHRQPPFINGQEWKFSSEDKDGQPFNYFSLAFRVELRA